METFSRPAKFETNPHFQKQKQKTIATLTDSMIDPPIIDIVKGFNKLPYSFTLQSCYGHFIYKGQNDSQNLEPLPLTDSIEKVEYRIAYIALCLENSPDGKKLLESMKKIESFNSENIQLCSARWFWERQVNSYSLQVEPDRFKDKDKAILDYDEALKIEKIRNDFFAQLFELVSSDI